MLLRPHGNIWVGYLTLLLVLLLAACQCRREWLLFSGFYCTVPCFMLAKQLKTSKWWADRYNPTYRRHTLVSSQQSCAPSHFINHTWQHMSKTTGRKGCFLFPLHFCIFQTVTLAGWGMRVRENTCIMSVRAGSLQTLWHTSMNTGRLCGMEHTWSAQPDTHVCTVTWTPPLSPQRIQCNFTAILRKINNSGVSCLNTNIALTFSNTTSSSCLFLKSSASTVYGNNSE